MNNYHKISECPICSEVCVNHLHYGGISCYSCKAFFRRSVTSPSKKTSRCRRGNGNCDLKLHLRNNCPFCRFMKCLSTGMKPELVLSKAPKLATDGILKPEEKDDTVTSVFKVLPCDNRSLKDLIDEEILILSVNKKINLMCTRFQIVIDLDRRIKNFPGNINQNVFLVAQMEMAFLKAKHSVSNFLLQLIKKYQNKEIQRTQGAIFSSTQEYFVKLTIVFLQNCSCFQSIPQISQSDLLRKNISEVSILLASMCFNREKQEYMWSIGGPYDDTSQQVLHLKEDNLSEFLEANIVKDLFKVSNMLSDSEIPGHLSIILILIIIFSRDGISMEGQFAIDTARSYYLHLLYRYMKLTNSDSSRLNASLHSILKTVKDYAELIRSQLVVNFNQ